MDVKDDEHKENNVESNDENDAKKFIWFDEFEKIFYHTFLMSDAEAQILVLSGHKDVDKEDKDLISIDQDDSVDKTKVEEDNMINLHSNEKSITGLYDELKKETKRDKEKLDQEKMIDDLKNEVDNEVAKEEAIEAKKRELVLILNDVTNSNDFKYEDGKVVEVLKKLVKKSPSEKADKDDWEENTKKSYKSEREKSEEELLKALEGFNL